MQKQCKETQAVIMIFDNGLLDDFLELTLKAKITNKKRLNKQMVLRQFKKKPPTK